MNKDIKEYLMNHTLEEITKDWEDAQQEKDNKFRAWLKFLDTHEQENDEAATYLHSMALRLIFNNQICGTNFNNLYTDENFQKVKNKILENLQYDAKHSRGADKKFYTDLLKNQLEKYGLK